MSAVWNQYQHTFSGLTHLAEAAEAGSTSASGTAASERDNLSPVTTEKGRKKEREKEKHLLCFGICFFFFFFFCAWVRVGESVYKTNIFLWWGKRFQGHFVLACGSVFRWWRSGDSEGLLHVPTNTQESHVVVFRSDVCLSLCSQVVCWSPAVLLLGLDKLDRLWFTVMVKSLSWVFDLLKNQRPKKPQNIYFIYLFPPFTLAFSASHVFLTK